MSTLSPIIRSNSTSSTKMASGICVDLCLVLAADEPKQASLHLILRSASHMIARNIIRLVRSFQKPAPDSISKMAFRVRKGDKFIALSCPSGSSAAPDLGPHWC